MPKNSTIASRAADIITKTWESVSLFWNPTLRTLGGPWDRSYGFNMVYEILPLSKHIDENR